MKKYFLKTERLGFSIWDEKDTRDAIEIWCSKAVTKYITATGEMSKEQALQRLKKEIDTYNSISIQYWPVYLIETGENIGCCGVRPYNQENHILEMGVHLKEQFWRKGYGAEACTAVIKYSLNVLGANAIFAGHNPKNTASAEMLKKLGFKYLRDEFYPPTGLYHPSYLLKRQDQ
ncbi:MAG: GNAT family N-acetyltransferase [Solirubrobacterales bacterium]